MFQVLWLLLKNWTFGPEKEIRAFAHNFWMSTFLTIFLFGGQKIMNFWILGPVSEIPLSSLGPVAQKRAQNWPN